MSMWFQSGPTPSAADALVQLGVPVDSRWRAQLDGRDVTQSFRPTYATGTFPGLLTGLKNEDNHLQISVNGIIQKRLDIRIHPLKGPSFPVPIRNPSFARRRPMGSVGR
jgi:hypothetical protein